MSHSKMNSTSKARPDTVSDIVGLEVYTKSGTYIGTVEDIRVNFNQNTANGVALQDVNSELEQASNSSGKGIVIPYHWINSVHDIIITIDIIKRLDYN